MWTAWAATRAPAPRGSLENTARGISMNACRDPATPPAASTACSWSTTTSAAVALDTRVCSRQPLQRPHYVVVLCVRKKLLGICVLF